MKKRKSQTEPLPILLENIADDKFKQELKRFDLLYLFWAKHVRKGESVCYEHNNKKFCTWLKNREKRQEKRKSKNVIKKTE